MILEHEECVKCRLTGGNCIFDPVYNVDLKLIWNVTCLSNETNRSHGFGSSKTSLGVILGMVFSHFAITYPHILDAWLSIFFLMDVYFCDRFIHAMALA